MRTNTSNFIGPSYKRLKVCIRFCRNNVYFNYTEQYKNEDPRVRL